MQQIDEFDQGPRCAKVFLGSDRHCVGDVKRHAVGIELLFMVFQQHRFAAVLQSRQKGLHPLRLHVLHFIQNDQVQVGWKLVERRHAVSGNRLKSGRQGEVHHQTGPARNIQRIFVKGLCGCAYRGQSCNVVGQCPVKAQVGSLLTCCVGVAQHP